MLVIPAIDLKGGRCVRLVEGREQSARVYYPDPVELAMEFQSAGAKLIHMVDLDGAFQGGESANRQIIARIAGTVSIPIEVGGGVRSMDDIDVLFTEIGARYVILGTLAVEQPEIVEQAIRKHGDAIVVGIDARRGEVATRGWTRAAGRTALELAGQVAGMGIERIVYTDISRDGRLEGPNFEATAELAKSSGTRVTASGGISSLQDISRMRDFESDGVDSVIVGKALYEGLFTVREAIDAATRPRRNDI